MTVRILALGAPCEQALLGSLAPLQRWFRDADALYMLTDGIVDAPYAGSLTDASDNDQTAAPMAGATPPVRTVWGHEATAVDGYAYLTPFAWQGDFTVILAARQSIGDGAGEGFPTVFGCTQGMGVDLSHNNPRNHGVFIDINIHTTGTDPAPLQVGVLAAVNFNSGATRRFVSSTAWNKQDPFVVALCVDQAAKRIRLVTEFALLDLPGETAVCADIAASTGNFAFGIFKGAGGLDVAGGLSACAFFLGEGAMSEADLAFNMHAARLRLIGAGAADVSLNWNGLTGDVIAALALKADTNLDNVTGPGAIGTGDQVRGVATAGQTTIVMAHAVPAGKEEWIDLYIGGQIQDPGVDFTCNGTTTLTLTGDGMDLGEAWRVLHRLGPA